MFPGDFAASVPDRPAQIMASTGAVQTYAELDAAANRLSRRNILLVGISDPEG